LVTIANWQRPSSYLQNLCQLYNIPIRTGCAN